MLTVDALAQEIRRVDGSNSLSAGALAEALMPFFDTTPANPAQGVSEKLDNLSPDESIGAFDGSGQWIEVYTVAELRQSASEASRVADALEACDWSGPSIGNKAILQKAVELLRSAAIGAGGQAVAMTVIDPDEWEPCSPSYLSRGGSCSAPRVWNAAEGNHWQTRDAMLPMRG